MGFGFSEGEVCGRQDVCGGIIETRPVENCSCHINAPCYQCTSPRNYCPLCGWEEADEGDAQPIAVDYQLKTFASYRERELDPTKIDYRIKPYCSSAQLVQGVYPEGTTRSQVEERVIGTFGGCFNHFGGGKFEYLAYTD